MKRRLSVVLALLMALVSVSGVFAVQRKKTYIVSSSFSLGEPQIKGKNAVFLINDVTEMGDMVNTSDLGALRGGGVGCLYLPGRLPSGVESATVIIDAPTFSEIVGKGYGSRLHGFKMEHTLGVLEFVGQDHITKLGEGEFRFDLEKKEPSILDGSAKATVGKRPIYDFSLRVNNRPIPAYNKGTLIRLPYYPQKGEEKNCLALYRVDGGHLSIVASSVYKEETRYEYEQDVEHRYIEALIDEGGIYAVGYKEVSYSDIKGWYKPYANFVMARGIMNEKKGMFSPNDPITRGDLAFYLKNMSDDRGRVSQSNFKDVPRSHPYANSIDWAYAKGLIKGYSDGSFKPDQVISRQELAAMLYRYIEVDAQVPMPTLHQKQTFKDGGKIASYAKEAISSLQQSGVIDGRGNGYFVPQANVTRAECAKMIVTVMEGIMDGKNSFVWRE
ncbi:S-layer homology domain-containing protein [Filifactor villosus]|uniref:S-layer homology domain-containing protein n=1 Tax=Filifactor villosus TaxID=29374 RepID=A0ABV9QLL1_9FIRM